MTAPIRDHISRLRDGGVEAAAAVPAGRFFRGVDRVWRQRYRLDPGFPMFGGHFPGQPVLPALAHALLARSVAESFRGGPLAVAGIAQAKFLTPVAPGAVLDVFMAPSREADGVWLFQNFRVEEARTVEAARIVMTLRPS